jgi:hypothetical protein
LTFARRAVAAMALLTAVAGCTVAGDDARPDPGPGGGPVDVRPTPEPAPGASLTLHLSAGDGDFGSACATLDEWTDEGWRARWYWIRSFPAPVPISDEGEVACPATAIRLPASQAIVLPEEIGRGTWRLAYDAEGDLGAYVFEVG